MALGKLVVLSRLPGRNIFTVDQVTTATQSHLDSGTYMTQLNNFFYSNMRLHLWLHHYFFKKCNTWLKKWKDTIKFESLGYPSLLIASPSLLPSPRRGHLYPESCLNGLFSFSALMCLLNKIHSVLPVFDLFMKEFMLAFFLSCCDFPFLTQYYCSEMHPSWPV